MQANVGHETSAERRVRSHLHWLGLRFRNDVKPLPELRCAADLVFRSAKICIFVDGCFWHGCPKHYQPPATNTSWWDEKIAANRARDRRNALVLTKAGWQVIRIWEHQVRPAILNKVAERIRRRLQSKAR